MSDNQLLESTKKDIRSLLLPNKNGLILKGLQEEHQAVLGHPIPSRKLGFYSDLEFLRSIPSVVEVINLPDKVNILCKAVVDPKLEHIRQLVARQRSNVAGYNKQTKHVLDRQKFYKDDVGIRHEAFTANSGVNSWEDHFQFMPNKHVYGASRNTIQRRTRGMAPNLTSQRVTRKGVNTNFKKDCLTIAEKHPDGLEIKQFEACYRKLTNKNINYAQFGFMSIEECLLSIPDVILFRKKSDKSGKLHDIIFSSYYANKYDEAQTGVSKNTVPVMKLTRPTGNACVSSSSSDSFKSYEKLHSEEERCFDRNALVEEHVENFVQVSDASLRKIQENLVKLLSLNPNGIEVTNLEDAYLLEFGQKLNYSVFSCTSVEEMCITVNTIFRTERSKKTPNSWVVFSVLANDCGTSEPPKCSEEELSQLMENVSQLMQNDEIGTLTKEGLSEKYLKLFKKAINLKKIGMSMDELLNFLVDKNIIELSVKVEDPFKPSCNTQEVLISRKKLEIKTAEKFPDKTISIARMRLKSIQDQLGGESIPVQELPKYTMIDSTIEIIMGEIWSPTKFWILQKAYYEQLIELGREMTVFYGDRNTEHLMLPESHVVDGQVCAVREGADHEGDWYRSVIVNILDTQTVTVQDIDYGLRRKAKIEHIRFLRRDFAESLKAQAIPSKLANIIPPNGSKSWSKRASQYFAEIATKSKDDGLFGIIKGLHQGICRKLSLLLYDTAANDLENGIYINQELVNNSLADVDLHGDQTEGYELSFSKELVGSTEQKCESITLPPLRLPTLLISNSSSGYGTGPPLSPVSTGPNGNTRKSWLSSFMPNLPFINQLGKETSGYSNNNSIQPTTNCNIETLSKDLNYANTKEMPTHECRKRGISVGSSTSTEMLDVKKVVLQNTHIIHIIYFEECRYVISAEISSLFPRWRNKDVLEQMVELKKLNIPKKVFTQEEHTNIFQELILAEVKGLTTQDGNLVKRLVIYSLEFIPEMLRIFHGTYDAKIEEIIKEIQSEIEKIHQ